MIEKINKILEKLPEEYRDSIREIVEIIIKEEIEQNRKMIQELWDIIKEGNRAHNERFERLEKALIELTQAIKESNNRMDRMEQRMNKEFQRIWQAIESLTQAVNELRQITKEQGERIDNLTKAFEKRKKLETLSDNFGYLLEDRAIRYLPKLLKEKYNIRIIEPLRRGYIKLGKKYIKVNIYGNGKRGDEEFIIIGEAKTRLSQKEVNKFIEKCNEIGGRQFRILISYIIPPQLENMLLNNNIEFINSYELLT
ncbi:MAG: hypothetical protein ABIL47_02820 [candidate division WOR-3 bacterium]